MLASLGSIASLNSYILDDYGLHFLIMRVGDMSLFCFDNIPRNVEVKLGGQQIVDLKKSFMRSESLNFSKILSKSSMIVTHLNITFEDMGGAVVTSNSAILDSGKHSTVTVTARFRL